MPITKSVSNVITYTAKKPLNTPSGEDTGVSRAADFAVCDSNDFTKQLKVDLSGSATGATVTLKAPAGATGNIEVTLPSASATLSSGLTALTILAGTYNAATQGGTAGQTYNLKDSNGNDVVIPAGYAVVHALENLSTSFSVASGAPGITVGANTNVDISSDAYNVTAWYLQGPCAFSLSANTVKVTTDTIPRVRITGTGAFSSGILTMYLFLIKTV